MSDFYGCLESTSFRVKDTPAFLAEPAVQQAKKIADFFDQNEDGYFHFGWYGQYPTPVLTEWNDETDEEIEYDLLDAIQRHIREGDLCQIGVSGNEKLRYIGGGLWFITSKGVASFDGVTEWSNKLTPKVVRDDIAKLLKAVKAL